MSDAFPGGLEPALVWKHFDAIRRIPRGSGHEQAAAVYVESWAAERALAVRRDAVGNRLVCVPGSAGREGSGVTVLQGHLDMVCEANADVAFDFATDGIDVVVEGDHVTAVGTTLGADNGLGVAAAMAVAEDPTAEHPPLEILLTVDEETGMSGAFGLEPGFVTGRRMLNLDTEEPGAVYVGCSGGGDVAARWDLSREACPEGFAAYRAQVKGLVGGHSGLDIHENRANAIKCLARTLRAVGQAAIDHHLVGIDGGSKRNAIPREAGATLALRPGDLARLTEVVARAQAELKVEFGGTDPHLAVVVEPHPELAGAQVFRGEDARRIVHSLLASPSGVVAMSRDVPGLVETSNNLGVIRTEGGVVEVVHCSRSSIGSALEAVRAGLVALYGLAGAEVRLEAAYPGWKPDLSSSLLATALSVHRELFGDDAEVKAVHAGLECGLIGERYPGMEMISFGPDIRGAHSPAERVHIPSVSRFYAHLKGILAALD